MSEKQEPTIEALTALIVQGLAERGPEFGLAMDTDRIWATAMQCFLNPPTGTALVVFREQNFVADESGQPKVIFKNVASVIVPIPILAEFHQNLGAALKTIQATGEDVGE